ncbi:hypothetical protein HDF26_000182 [Pedobacter cryoconitis]|uniref:Uncharacterized protein n=1 Tax=Pedobacter cryoconitis TaxID=188932 RepID=A0A7W8ZP06_9SPHI|nr:hypothetical protein [Pedobacter cryoconitis]MBB6269755.1 hypothetical protein [Pedobacter cryoconitis]
MIKYLLYIDPGTGSLFYQAILSAVLTLSVFGSRIKVFVLQVIRNVKAKKGNKQI